MSDIPDPILEAIDAGVPVLKAFRVYSETSIRELADATLLDPSRICLIEAGLHPTRVEASLIEAALSVPKALAARHS